MSRNHLEQPTLLGRPGATRTDLGREPEPSASLVRLLSANVKPVAEVEGCRAAHRRIDAGLALVTDQVAVGPSLVPGWSVAHVLAHLANNAEAMSRRIKAARSGQLIEQYPGGAQGRADDIEDKSTMTAAALVSRVVATAHQLDSLFDSLADEEWNLPVRTVSGSEHPLGLLPFRRWREVEVHHTDLDSGFTPAEWSPGLIDRALPRLLAGLESRTDRAALTAWLLGRADAPALDPWG